MQPIEQMPPEIALGIDTVFSDIDDTITLEGLVPAIAYDAVWRAREAGIRVVLVTGRPAGWCDHLARMWPVAGVVGENGALAFTCTDGRMQRLYAERPDDSARGLEVIRQQVLSEVPRCKVAADQPYREYDLAIDISEEVDPLNDEEIDHIVSVFEQHGARAKVSSVHVNGWFGDFDKLTMCRRWSESLGGGPIDTGRATFAGDSPNDEPMFAHFPYACGVANVRHLAHRMHQLPRYVTHAPGGEGFAELIGHLLRNRQ